MGLLLLLTRSALAAEPPVELSWDAPAECPSRDAVLARIQTMLGRSSSKLTPVRATGVIEKRAAGFELRLAIEGGKGGQREVFAQRCDELGGVAAVALALLLTTNGQLVGADTLDGAQPPSGEHASEPSPAGEVESKTSPPDAEAASESAVEPSRTPRPRVRWLADAPLFGLGIGPLPKPHPALGLGLGVESGGLSLRVVGLWGLAQQIPASAPGYGAEVRRASVGLWGCAEVSGAPVSVSPCLQASLTHVAGQGYGPSLRSASQKETSGALGGGILGRWRIHDRLGLLVGVSAQVELSRPVLLLKPLGTFQQLAPFSATLLLGPEWIF